MNVELLNKEQIKDLYKNHGLFACGCYATPDKYADKVGKACQKSGHMSGSRCEYFIFRVNDVDRGCYDEETEILTIEGWKFFKDISENEVVATLNPSTKNVEFNEIKNKFCFDVDEDLIRYKKSNLDLLVTNDHKMYIKKYDVRVPCDYTLTKAKDIHINRYYMYRNFNLVNPVPNTITIKGYEYVDNGGAKKRTKDLTFDRKTFYKFLAWYISDGSCWYDRYNNTYSIYITQTNCERNIKNKTVEQILDILKKMGMSASYNGKKRIQFRSMTLGNYLSKIGISLEKYIPLDIFYDFNQELAKLFIDEYFKADGHLYSEESNAKLYSSSKKLIDQLDILCYIAGYVSKVYPRNNKKLEHVIEGRTVNLHNNGGYYINVSLGKMNSSPLIIAKDDVTLEHYTGKVYCVEVDNHIVFVRRNGTAVWCGNSAEQCLRHEVGVKFPIQDQDNYYFGDVLDINPSDIVKNMASFRYIDKDGFDYTIPKNIQNNSGALHFYKSLMNEIDLKRRTIKELLEKDGVDPKKATEDANFVLPRATNSMFTIGLTPEALINFMHKRLCVRAQDEVRAVAIAMKKAVTEVLPEWAEKNLVPHCKYLLWCPEGDMSCGAAPTKEEVKEKIK